MPVCKSFYFKPRFYCTLFHTSKDGVKRKTECVTLIFEKAVDLTFSQKWDLVIYISIFLPI
jgi:hypothetical protein